MPGRSELWRMARASVCAPKPSRRPEPVMTVAVLATWPMASHSSAAVYRAGGGW